MGKQSRFLLLALCGALVLLVSGASWNRYHVERARVVRVEVAFDRLELIGNPAAHRKWMWTGAQAQTVADRFVIDKAGCVGPVNGMRSLSFGTVSMVVTSRQGKPVTRRIYLEDGLSDFGEDHCEAYLMPRSLKYFRDLVAHTPSNAK